MIKEKIDGRKVVKGGLKLFGRCAVDMAVCALPAAVLPLAVLSAPVGIMVVIGGAICTEVVCGAQYDKKVDEIVDGCADHFKETAKEVKECMDAIKKDDKEKT